MLKNHRHEPQDRLSSTAKVGYGRIARQSLTARIAAAVMQQQQSSRAHGTKPSAVQGTIYRSPRAIGDVVGLRRSGSARGRDEIGQAVRPQTSDGCGARNPFMGVFVDLCPGAGVGGPVLSCKDQGAPPPPAPENQNGFASGRCFITFAPFAPLPFFQRSLPCGSHVRPTPGTCTPAEPGGTPPDAATARHTRAGTRLSLVALSRVRQDARWLRYQKINLRRHPLDELLGSAG